MSNGEDFSINEKHEIVGEKNWKTSKIAFTCCRASVVSQRSMFCDKVGAF